MKKKLILSLLISIFCQKSFSQIVSITLLTKGTHQIIVFGDIHVNETESISQFNFLNLWLKKLSNKTKYIIEIRKPTEDLASLIKYIQGLSEIEFQRLTLNEKKLIGKLMYFSLRNTNNNLKFDAADLRSGTTEDPKKHHFRRNKEILTRHNRK